MTATREVRIDEIGLRKRSVDSRKKILAPRATHTYSAKNIVHAPLYFDSVLLRLQMLKVQARIDRGEKHVNI